ncbi:MAG TPA: tRNA (adenosine(37)-N6)-threonylcarbamoyltransferase complex transferase subunit TsaD [Lentisphaeria bacterium]|nr:tRNA (adenosine(37)-N6)-threonylcarbamoyltransferase complex transferase subunit TsaD [Lentisphaeria bacterium]
MLILGLETSCDETAAAIVRDGQDVLANVISSQIAKHAAYGGVIPELAAREHLKAVQPVVELALREAGIEASDLDGIAVTSHPGLLPALIVGISYAKGLAASLEKPLIGINHFTAHIYGAFLEKSEKLRSSQSYPILSLVVSGGHTALVLIRQDGSTEVVGQTLDDAAGEAFDKAARIMNLGYPGGPLIDRLARRGDPTSHRFPRGLLGGGGTPLRDEDRLNFSFSGVKTSLLYHCRKLDPLPDDCTEASMPQPWLDTIAAFQQAIVDVLVRKTTWAVEKYDAKTVVLCGGVACNSQLRTAMTDAFSDRELLIAAPKYCTDNAAMIAGLGYHELAAGARSGWDLDATARLPELDHVSFTSGE